MDTYKQPWIGKPVVEVIFILLPPFASLLFIALFPSLFANDKGVSTAGWVILILLIDVAHVYSTLYRTYFDPREFKKQRSLLVAIPFIGFIVGVLAYSVSSQLFWRLLAYTAVFHFIRQQYGFMRVYSRKDNADRFSGLVDKVTIYYATIFPILYWHLKGPRNFNWFVDNDFFYLQSPEIILNLLRYAYYAVLILYIIKEIIYSIKVKYVNVPKVAVITGTILSWYFGIIYFNGDLAFTLLNIVSHGIPYMALIWLYGNKKYTTPGTGSRFLKLIFSRYGIAFFLLILFLFAWVEEGLWDFAVWKERGSLFGTSFFPDAVINNTLLSLIVPLLAIPQITHYILDGFIWRIRQDEFKWNSEVKQSES